MMGQEKGKKKEKPKNVPQRRSKLDGGHGREQECAMFLCGKNTRRER